MLRSVLIGTGSHLPKRAVSNDELSQTVDTSDEWIVERTGIRNRYIAGDDETTSSLATEAARKAIAAVKGAGGRIALSLSDSFCVGRFRDEFLHLLDKDVNILFANEDEAKALFQQDSFDGVIAAAKQWGGIAALTRSAKGCVIIEEGQEHVVPAAPVSRVIDTTGAGDQFAAGFLYGMTNGKGLADCGKLGALAAAEVISHYGARPEASLKELAAKAGLI